MKYKKGDIASGKVGDYYTPYDFTCTLKGGALSKVVKSGDDYHANETFSFENGRITSEHRISREMYDIPCDKVTHYYYNADGTLGSVDYHEVAYIQTGGVPEVDDVYFAYGY